jgi:AcrR family transcriptional regulator
MQTCSLDHSLTPVIDNRQSSATVLTCLHWCPRRNLVRRLSECEKPGGSRRGHVCSTPRWPRSVTFYFHFPTKEHVVVELERAEEAKIVAKLDTRTSESDDLVSVLSLLVREVLVAERRLGPVVFRDMLGLHFSATRPVEDELGEHPLAEFVIAAIAEGQAAGRVSRDADAGELGVFFLTGLFALLATGGTASRARAAMLDRYVKTIVQGMETR